MILSIKHMGVTVVHHDLIIYEKSRGMIDGTSILYILGVEPMFLFIIPENSREW